MSGLDGYGALGRITCLNNSRFINRRDVHPSDKYSLPVGGRQEETSEVNCSDKTSGVHR